MQQVRIWKRTRACHVVLVSRAECRISVGTLWSECKGCSPADSLEKYFAPCLSPPPTLRPLQRTLSNIMSFLIPAGGASARLASQRSASPACQLCAKVSCSEAFSATGTAGR